MPAPGEYEDVSGQRFGQLTAVELFGAEPYTNPRGYNSFRTYWLFICDCGRSKVVRLSHAKSGMSTSCGCARGRMCDSVHDIGVSCERAKNHRGLHRVKVRNGESVEF